MLDKDYVEAIIKLPDQGFIDTGISIYAWIISKNGKNEKRKNIIQVIDASEYFHTLKKGIGYKRKEMSVDKGGDVDKIVSLYKNFDPKSPSKNVKYLKKEDFYYAEVTIQQPYQRNFRIIDDRIGKLFEQNAFASLFDEEEYLDLNDKEATLENLNRKKSLEAGKVLQGFIIDTLNKNLSNEIYHDVKCFTKQIEVLFPSLEKKYIKAIVNALSEKDKVSNTYTDKKTKSGLLADSDLNDSELVPVTFYADNKDKLTKSEFDLLEECNSELEKSVVLYFNSEVKPFVPDAWYQDGYDLKIGCEINMNKLFYNYSSPISSSEILGKIKQLEEKEANLIGDLFDD